MLTLNVTPKVKKAVMAHKRRVRSHSVDETIQHLLDRNRAYESIMADLQEKHVRLYNRYRLRVMIERT